MLPQRDISICIVLFTANYIEIALPARPQNCSRYVNRYAPRQ
jgi:hypothetical protein